MKDTQATRKDIDDVLQVLKGFIQQADERFNIIDFQINQTSNKLETGIDGLKASHSHLVNTINTLSHV